MLPGMAAKPRIAIIGAGNLGTALAVSLSDAGYTISAVVAHSKGRSLKSAQMLAKQVGSRATSDFAQVKADLVWICVPDSEIASLANSLAGKIDWKKKIALHSSGALTSQELNPLRRKGARVASVHPMMTFVRDSQPSLLGVPFAIEGNVLAVRAARRIVRDLGGHAYSITMNDKAAYHAWGTFASPLLTALLATTEQVAHAAGVGKKAATRRIIPILLQTLANYASFGAAGAFSGPIVRGDVETVGRHLRVLRGVPRAREVYASLARASLEYLPGKHKSSIKRILGSAGK